MTTTEQETRIAWDTARALDGCLTDVRKAAESGLAGTVHPEDALRTIVRLIGDSAHVE